MEKKKNTNEEKNPSGKPVVHDVQEKTGEKQLNNEERKTEQQTPAQKQPRPEANPDQFVPERSNPPVEKM